MIESTYFWKSILLLGLGTLCIRGSIIFLSSKITLSDRLKEVFSFIPSAILPSLIAPMVFFHKGQVDWLLDKERFFILVLATLVCYLTRSMISTLCFGLGALFLVTQIGY